MKPHRATGHTKHLKTAGFHVNRLLSIGSCHPLVHLNLQKLHKRKTTIKVSSIIECLDSTKKAIVHFSTTLRSSHLEIFNGSNNEAEVLNSLIVDLQKGSLVFR